MWTRDATQVNIILLRHGSTKSNEEGRYLGQSEEPLSELGKENLREGVESGKYKAIEKMLVKTLLEFQQKQMVSQDRMKSGQKPEKAKVLRENFRIVLSPMKRCKESAELLSELMLSKLLFSKMKIALPDSELLEAKAKAISREKLLFLSKSTRIIEDWKEMNFGEFEGKNYAELNGNADYQAYIDSGGKLAFPGGESRNKFCERVYRGWELLKKEIIRSYTAEEALEVKEAIIDNSADAEGRIKEISILSFVHGGTIMALMSLWTGGNYFDFQVKNGEGCLCRFSMEGEELSLKEWSSIS